MNEKIVLGNLGAVKAEYHDILKNIESLRGARHANLVHGFITSMQIGEVIGKILNAGDFNEETFNAYAKAVMGLVEATVTSFVQASEIPEEDLVEILSDVTRIEKTVSQMISTAIHAGNKGTAFTQ